MYQLGLLLPGGHRRLCCSTLLCVVKEPMQQHSAILSWVGKKRPCSSLPLFCSGWSNSPCSSHPLFYSGMRSRLLCATIWSIAAMGKNCA
jgi:hypothetical protein